MAMDAELLGVLPALESAPDGWRAEVFAVRRKPPPLPPDGDDASMVPMPRELADVLSPDVLAALEGAARRPAVAALASLLACANRDCRTAVDAFACAEQRAAIAAQAQATHDMAHALLILRRGQGKGRCKAPAELLAAWCRAENASAALDGYYDDAESPADKWRAFALEFAHTCAETMPQRIRHARDTLLHRNWLALGAVFGGHPVPPLSEEMEELAVSETMEWLVELLQGAPA